MKPTDRLHWISISISISISSQYPNDSLYPFYQCEKSKASSRWKFSFQIGKNFISL